MQMDDCAGEFVVGCAGFYLGLVPCAPNDYRVAMFDTLMDASEFPFASRHSAAAVVVDVLVNTDLDCAIVDVVRALACVQRKTGRVS